MSLVLHLEKRLESTGYWLTKMSKKRVPLDTDPVPLDTAPHEARICTTFADLAALVQDVVGTRHGNPVYLREKKKMYDKSVLLRDQEHLTFDH